MASQQERNGRVDTLYNDNYNAYDLFKDEKKPNRDFQQEAVRGIWQANDLSRVFFSPENTEALQQGIRYLVWKKSCKKHVIGKQSETELHIIMRSIYLQYAEHHPYNILEQVRQLNTLVLNYCVQKILEEINIYTYYRKDIAQLPVPMDRGQYISSKGSKVLETKNL